MEKPTKPKEPDIQEFPPEKFGFPKFPKDESHPWIKACMKYEKNLNKYNADLEIWEQAKLVKDIQRSSVKLCLKKYHITKIK